MPYRSIRGVLVVVVLLLLGAIALGGFFLARRVVPHPPVPSSAVAE